MTPAVMQAWSTLDSLGRFIAESNLIEGITRPPTHEELDAAGRFLDLNCIAVADMETLVGVFQPDAVLRDRPRMNVRVGRYVAPPGGPAIRSALESLLHDANTAPAHAIHVAYELLHPFTDGNGRSGRMLWKWMMHREGNDAPLGFLHHFYYQTLEAAR